jgi:hypothetical protein
VFLSVKKIIKRLNFAMQHQVFVFLGYNIKANGMFVNKIFVQRTNILFISAGVMLPVVGCLV